MGSFRSQDPHPLLLTAAHAAAYQVFRRDFFDKLDARLAARRMLRADRQAAAARGVETKRARTA